MLLSALRTALGSLFAAICVILLTGGLLVSTLNATNLLADSTAVPDTVLPATAIMIILFSMAVLAPIFEWWFKIWRNADRWLQVKFSNE